MTSRAQEPVVGLLQQIVGEPRVAGHARQIRPHRPRRPLVEQRGTRPRPSGTCPRLRPRRRRAARARRASRHAWLAGAVAPARAGARARRRRAPRATKPMPSAIARMATTCSGCAASSMTPFFANQSPTPAGREDDAGLHRPEDAVERRADGMRRASRRRRHRRCRQEPLAGRRLHVGEQVFVRRQPIDDLGVRVGLNLRRPQPAPVVDRRRATSHASVPMAEHDAEQDLEPDEHVLDCVPSCAERLSWYCWPRTAAEEEDRVVRDLRMLGEEGRQRRVGRQVVRPASAATGRAGAPAPPTAGTARGPRAAGRACRARSARPRGGAGAGGRLRRAGARPVGAGRGWPPTPAGGSPASSSTRKQPPFLSSSPSIYAAGRPEVNRGRIRHVQTHFPAVAGSSSRFSRRSPRSRGRRRHQREDSPGREQPLADHADAAHADRRLRSAGHRLAEPEGRRRMGDQADGVAGASPTATSSRGISAIRAGSTSASRRTSSRRSRIS